MIYITGDTHGDQYQWSEKIAPALGEGDQIIVVGDFGVGFWNGRYWDEEQFFDWLSEQPYTVLFIDGNHENFQKLGTYPVESWNGGKIHRLRDNLIHLMRGEVYQMDGKSLFTFGGGYSIDKYRRKEGISWWPEEMPSQEEYQNAERNLEMAGNCVDYIITHTAPSESVYYLSTMRNLGIMDNVVEERPLTTFLDEIQRRISYKRWYCGHFHVDVALWRGQTVVFQSIRELESGRLVRRWEAGYGL